MIASSTFGGRAVAAPPAHGPAASQYVEQIPTASGSKATAAPSHSRTRTGTTPAAAVKASPSPTTKTSASRRRHVAPAKPKRSTKQRHVSPIRAAVAASNGAGGIGRGTIVGFVLVAATLLALAGLAVRRRLSR